MVVSENMPNFISIRLNKQISCEAICSKIQKLINDYQKNNNMKESILAINISNIQDSHLTHKPLGIPFISEEVN